MAENLIKYMKDPTGTYTIGDKVFNVSYANQQVVLQLQLGI